MHRYLIAADRPKCPYTEDVNKVCLPSQWEQQLLMVLLANRILLFPANALTHQWESLVHNSS